MAHETLIEMDADQVPAIRLTPPPAGTPASLQYALDVPLAGGAPELFVPTQIAGAVVLTTDMIARMGDRFAGSGAVLRGGHRRSA